MSWAANYIERLKQGETVSFRPKGHSMKGRIQSGQLVTVVPCRRDQLSKNDIVLCQVGRSHYLHLIKAVKEDKFLIGNNKGGINGWIGEDSIFGKYVSDQNHKG